MITVVLGILKSNNFYCKQLNYEKQPLGKTVIS